MSVPASHLELACQNNLFDDAKTIIQQGLKPSLPDLRRYYQLTTSTEIQALLKGVYHQQCADARVALRDLCPPELSKFEPWGNVNYEDAEDLPSKVLEGWYSRLYSEYFQNAFNKNDEPNQKKYRDKLINMYYEVVLPAALTRADIEPFMFAAMYGLLAELKAEWPTQNLENKIDVALNRAAHHGHLHVVKYLVEQGAKPGRNDKTTLDVGELCVAGQLEILKFLLEKFPQMNTDGGLQGALYAHHNETYQLILPHTRNINDASFRKGHSALVIAATRGNQLRIKELLEGGADPNLPCMSLDADHQVTPLYEACRLRFDEVVGQLLVAGATVDFKDEQGRSAIHMAAQSGCIKSFQKVLPLYGQSLQPDDWNQIILAADKARHSDWYERFGKTPFIQFIVNSYTGPLSLEAIACVTQVIPDFTRASTVKAPELTPAASVEVAHESSDLNDKETTAPAPVVVVQTQTEPTKAIEKTIPRQFLHDARYALMQDWVKSHLKSRSSLFEINRLKHQLMENAVNQLSMKPLDGAPLSTILTTPVTIAMAKPPTAKQIEMLKSKHNLDISQPLTLLQLSQLQRNPWSHGFTSTTQHLLSKISSDLSVRDKFVLYLKIQKARLEANKKFDMKTSDKLDYIGEAISLLERKSEESKDYTLSILLNTVVSLKNRFGINEPKMVHALEMHRGRHFFGTTTSMSDLKLVFGDREVEQAAKVRSAERDNRFLLD